MIVTQWGISALRYGKTFFKALTRSKNSAKSVNIPKTENCDFVISTLEKDTVQISNKLKQTSKVVTQPATETTPAVFEGSQVSMHHYLNGSNGSYRNAYKAAISNKPLNKRDSIDIEYGLPQMLEIDQEFSKLPPLEKNCIVWRGRGEHPICKYLNEDFEIIDKAKVGDIIIPDKGYSYTGFTKELASKWSCPIEGRSIMYKIHLPKGAKVSRNLEHGGEILMPRNAEYKVISKEVNGEHTEIELEYILPTKDNVKEIEELMKRFNLKPIS